MAKYTQEERREFREVENSRIKAICFLIERNFKIAVVRRRQTSPDFHYELVVKKALFFLRSANELRTRGEVVLNNRFFRDALKEALKRDDLGFFVSVGRVLSREQQTLTEVVEKGLSCDALEAFLINYWCEKVDDETDPLCFLSMKKLCETCQRYLPSTHGLSEKLINDTWHDLGLQRVKGFKFRGPGLPRLKFLRSGHS